MTTEPTDKAAMRSAEEIGFALYRELKTSGVLMGGPANAIKATRAIERAIDDAIASQRAEPQTVPFNGKIGLAGGVRLAWGCSIHDAVQAACMAGGISENRAREIAYKATGDARERFEKTPANAELERFSSVSKPQAVPDDASSEMIEAGLMASLEYMKENGVDGLSPFSEYPSSLEAIRRMWKAMLAAAPKPEDKA
jgi:hypothetical protein